MLENTICSSLLTDYKYLNNINMRYMVSPITTSCVYDRNMQYDTFLHLQSSYGFTCLRLYNMCWGESRPANRADEYFTSARHHLIITKHIHQTYIYIYIIIFTLHIHWYDVCNMQRTCFIWKKLCWICVSRGWWKLGAAFAMLWLFARLTAHHGVK